MTHSTALAVTENLERRTDAAIKHEETFARNSIAKLNMRELKEVAEVFIASGAFTDVKQTAQAMVKIIAGQELGFSPIVSMTGIHFFNGKVSIGANLIASLIKDSSRYDYRINEHTAEACEIEFFQRTADGDVIPLGVPVRYTIADATKAGLLVKDNWKKYPADMLFAAVIRQGARRYCADILRGVTPETDTDRDSETHFVPPPPAQTTETIDGEVVDTQTGEVVAEQDPFTAPAADSPDSTPKESAAMTSKEMAVDLARRLHDDHGVEFEALAMQFLPEGVAKFGSLTEEQAEAVVPGLQELLRAKQDPA